MRLLLFSDVHTDLNAARSLVSRSSEADVVVGAGDFCSMRRRLEPTIEILSRIRRPTVVVPGNSESQEELQRACRQWEACSVLHGTATVIHDVPFFGIGGGIPVTPFGAWSYDFTEAEATELLADCPERAVLVSHSPPYGAVDVSSRGERLGSKALAEVVEARSPRLVVCGHIHGSWGRTEKLHGVPVHNAGPSGTLWELEP